METQESKKIRCVHEKKFSHTYIEEISCCYGHFALEVQSFHYSKKPVFLKTLFPCYLHYPTFLLKDDMSASVITNRMKINHKNLPQILGSE